MKHPLIAARAFSVFLVGFGCASPLRAAVCDGISAASGSPLTTVRVVSGLSLPLFVTAPPGDVNRLFIVEQDGRIQLLKNGTLPTTTFLDISGITTSLGDGGDNEQGLLGLAFHPDYANNRLFFVYYTDVTGENNVVARYERDPVNPDLALPGGTVIATFAHPSFGNHNGGMLVFSPVDGHLYVGTGDGGSACDPPNNAQSPSSPLGKLLRIDVDAPIPAEEIRAVGLRNPWRYCFDRLNGDLYVADVGQNQWEEVNYRPSLQSPADNYGWDIFEGTHCPNPSCTGTGSCNSIPSPVMPVVEYSHASGGCSVTGGYVYRGCRMPTLRGTYFYADYCAAFIKSFRMVAGAVTEHLTRTAELAPGGGLAIGLITSFGEDARGEIYIVDRAGEVFKIVPILPNLEVSGPGAAPLALGSPDWMWEDLNATSSHPITEYRVYRTPGNGSAAFDCVFRNTAPVWPGGDSDTPPPDGLFSYLVTARNAAGQQTSPGTGSDGAPRVLSAVPCPP